ncbi:MAG: hypothetical protein LR015_06130 [Verrucomicrobia bacterium]|nr:hypothetical protein [Verrucomicrobiota bacterium]
MRAFEQQYRDSQFVERFIEFEQAALPQSVIRRLTGAGASLDRERAQGILVLTLPERDQADIVRAHRVLQNTRRAIEEWPVYNSLQTSRRGFEEIGFEFGANELARLLNDVSFDDNTLTVARLYQLQQAANQVADLQSVYMNFAASMQQLRAEQHSVLLAKLADLYPQLLAADADNPIVALKNYADEANQWVQFWRTQEPNLVLSSFSVAEVAWLERNAGALPQAVAEWMDLVRDHIAIPAGYFAAMRVELSGLIDELESLTRQINDLLEPGMPLVTFHGEATTVFFIMEQWSGHRTH